METSSTPPAAATPYLADLGTYGAAPRYQIGAVAERTQLSHATLRHWDEIGLVTPSGRSEGGFRLYSEEDVQRILVVRRMKPLGFTLEEMQQLADAFDALRAPDGGGQERKDIRETLEACAAQAAHSLDSARRHLAYAEEFVALLGVLMQDTDDRSVPVSESGPSS